MADDTNEKLPLQPLPRDFRRWLFTIKSKLAAVKDIGPECVELMENAGQPQEHDDSAISKRVRMRVWAALIAGLRPEHEFVTENVQFGEVDTLLASLESCFARVDPALQGVAARRFWGLRLQQVSPTAVDAYIKDYEYYLHAITGDQGGLQNRAKVQNIYEGIRHLRSHSEELAEFIREISVKTYDVEYRLVLSRLRYLARIDAQAAVLSGETRNFSSNADTLRTEIGLKGHRTSDSTRRSIPSSKGKCYSCGSKKHRRNECPQRNAVCNHCGRRGHIKGVCRQFDRDRNSKRQKSSTSPFTSFNSSSSSTTSKAPLGSGASPDINNTSGSDNFEHGHIVTCNPVYTDASNQVEHTVARPNYSSLHSNTRASRIEVLDDEDSYYGTPSQCIASTTIQDAKALSTSTDSRKDSNTTFLADSGSSRHIVNNRKMLSNTTECDVTVTSFGGYQQQTTTMGTLVLHPDDSSARQVQLSRAIQAVGSESLLSVAEICKEHALRFVFTSSECIATTYDGDVILRGDQVNGVYELRVSAIPERDIHARGASVSSTPIDLVDRTDLAKSRLVRLHYSLGHLNYPALRQLIRTRRLDVPLSVADEDVPPCTVCAVTCLTRSPYARVRKYQASRVGDFIVGDIKTVGTQSIGNNTCFSIFVDVRSTRIFVYPMKSVHDTLPTIERLKFQIKSDTGEDVRMLHLDADPNFNTAQFRLGVNKLGIRLMIASGGGHSEVGLAERGIRTVWSRALRLLHHVTGRPADVGRLWAVAVREAVFISNNLPTRSVHIPQDRTPSEEYFNSSGIAYKSDLTNCIPFGCPCALLTNRPGKGIADKAKIGMALGYEPAQRLFRVMNLQTNRVQYSRSVRLLPHRRFTTSDRDVAHGAILLQKLGGSLPSALSRGQELLLDYDDKNDESSFTPDDLPTTDVISSGTDQSISDTPEDRSIPDAPGSSPEVVPISEHEAEAPWDDDTPLTIIRPGGDVETHPVDGSAASNVVHGLRLMAIEMAMHNHPSRIIPVKEDVLMRIQVLEKELQGIKVLSLPCPQTFAEAMNIPRFGLLFAHAVKIEIDGINKNQVLEWYVKVPVGHRPIKTKWVFKWQAHGDGTFRRCKARLTVCGYSQIHGVHFEDTFAPTASLDAIRLVISLACLLALPLRHLDVKHAYHFGELEPGVTIYIKQPDGFVLYDNPRVGCKLNKALYGTKQGGAAWDVVAHRELLNADYTSCPMERCLYVRLDDDNNIVGLIVKVVDDFLFAGHGTEYRRIVDTLNKHFEVVDMGDLDHFVGMDIHHDLHTGVTTINQRTYAESILKRFFNDDLRNRNVPITSYTRTQLDHKVDDSDAIGDSRYRELVGSLLYLATATRPDLLYAVSFYSRFNNCHTLRHWKGLVEVCRYLRATLDYGIKYDKRLQDRRQAAIFTDSSHADCASTRKSTYGFILRLCGGAVSFRCKRTEIVCLSSTESEYVTLTHAGKTAAWLKGVSLFLGPDINTSITDDAGIHIYLDNNAARLWAENCGYAARRNKHIDIRFRYINQLADTGVIRLRRIDTTDNPADFLTKPLGHNRLKYLFEFVGIGHV